ncbi:winged helix-turn-helix transcriptional regulator [Streptomyces boncukensis]|uniref:Helix-turn-helix transcriptional regulator n=1 Tax=Streptomyces boncukensis TaxID=2711219 RepID=A0A6G4X095_9ACTN|nr:helix-turn-helix domain-containing protein [Streptomyces boncukensis]NGO70310.1 helix-turn-helix transcriptional regulator [Streptomyces boncukensis]
MPSTPSRSRRSYDQFCATARALDSVGDRWTLLIVRELLAGPRRYTDLHADLPGVSTDVLAARLKHMESEGLVARRPLARAAAARVYELTARGRGLLPVLAALARWGTPELGEPRETDAQRAHWWALPMRDAWRAVAADGVVDVTLPEGHFHIRLGETDPASGAAVYGEGPAPEGADAEVEWDPGEWTAALRPAEGVRSGVVRVRGEGAVARALREG